MIVFYLCKSTHEGIAMRRLTCPLLLLLVATVPAHARFCDPLPQAPITGGGQECTQTRVAQYSLSTNSVEADYSAVALSGAPAPLEFGLDLAAMPSRFEGRVTLLEFGIAHVAETVDSPSPGGRLALEADIGEGVSQNRQLRVRWVWIEGSPTKSVMTPDDHTGQRDVAQEVLPPMPVQGELSVTVEPDTDWCHLRVSASDGFTDKYVAYPIAPGSACTAVVLRSGVMGPSLTEGMATSFVYHSQWLLNR
jgi:hypothetical protein